MRFNKGGRMFGWFKKFWSEEKKEGVIPCPRCRQDIEPGSPVVLYQDSGEFPEPKQLYTKDDKPYVVCCTRTQCCPSQGFLAGTWGGDYFSPLYCGRTFQEEMDRIVGAGRP